MTARAGRPLRFLALLLGSWTALRIAILWPQAGGLPPLGELLVPRAVAALVADQPHPAIVRQRVAILVGRTAQPAAKHARIHHPHHDPRMIALALAGLIRFGDPAIIARGSPAGQTLVTPPAALPRRTGRSRWSGDFWLLARGNGGSAAGFGVGQLGGSQAGVRVAYALGAGRRVALAARLTAPLRGPGREAALGIEWRPTRLPVRLVVEERLPLDGGKAGPAVGAVGGVGPTAIGRGFRLEAYGQAGIVDRGKATGFADGAARVTHPLATIAGTRIDWGGGVWGGAQTGVARLDIGPTLGVAIPIGKVAARITLDWRQRVAGNARPGSGLALSLGADF